MQADYVIVGAGSAGCAMAYRLAEAGKSVIVIEHGGSDWGPFIQMPGALAYPMNMARYDWGYRTEPEPNMSGRRMAVPRGKVLGGSSSINGMVYVRGHPGDFDHWRDSGAEGWGWADVLPYYRRMEDWHGQGDPEWRGQGGPLHVTRGPRDNPLHEAFVASAEAAGYGRTQDYNGHRQEGFGPMEMTVWQGQRWSVARAYLRPAMDRFGVRVMRALARRVVLRDGRAVGVEVERQGAVEVIAAGREVILAASSINSPKLLMLSGIGPARDLAAQGVEVVANRPGVGGNLQDHLEVYVQYASKQPVTLYKYWNLFGKAWVGAQWMFLRRGPGTSNQFESAGFIRSAAGVEYPDIQFHFLPLAVRYDGKGSHRGHGFQAHVGPMRSKSRGRVSLASPDPAAAPRIRFDYMSHPDDWTEFRAAIRLTQEIFRQAPMTPFVEREIGPAVSDDAGLDAFVRDHAESAYHPCGTCRMGRADDPHAVVDPECRVIGVSGLRVADSSIFPRITNGNLNAPSIMTGEKAADHILGRRLPPEERLVRWRHPSWQNQQR